MEVKKKDRPVEVFTVPPEIAAASGVREIGLMQLSSEEELLCYKKAKSDTAKLASELVKASLVEADGKPLNGHDGSVDTFWANIDPKLRQLALNAYADLHAAKDDEQESFLKSRKTKVG